MKYTEVKAYMKKHPYCFHPMEEQIKDFNRRIATAEKKPIVFAERSQG